MTDYIDQLSLRSVDSLPIRGARIDLIDQAKVKGHIERAIEHRRYTGPTDLETYLHDKRCVVIDGDDAFVTPAGILCFGVAPQDIFTNAVVNLVHYRGTTPNSTEVVHIEKNIGGTIIEQLMRIEDYLGKNTHHGMTLHPTRFERVEIDEYPSVVLRELSVNMLAHRDYQDIHSSARVRLFRNHIEWMNPGGLPEGMTVDQILGTQRSRNPVIFSILWEAGLIEAVGQGLQTVINVLAQEQMEPAQFEDINHAFFMARVAGRPLETFSASDVYVQLSDRQRRILSIIRSRTEVSSRDITAIFGNETTQRSIQRDIKVLVEKGLICAIGESHATRYCLYEANPAQRPLQS